MDAFNTRISWVEVFSKMCKLLKDRSTCLKYQTSAIVVKGTQILGIGYNGTASKQHECCKVWYDHWDVNYISDKNVNENAVKIPFNEWIKTDQFRDLHSEWSALNEIHAEVNALNWVSKKNIDDTCAIYTYYSPCEQCAKQILSYGIKYIYYCYEYKGRTGNGLNGLKFLRDNGVKCTQISS
jgi:dCMP deaminase